MSGNDQAYEDASTTARLAILDAITRAANDLHKHNAPAAAEGAKNLAEAYAWVRTPNNSH
jgi:hypothetical protein